MFTFNKLRRQLKGYMKQALLPPTSGRRRFFKFFQKNT